MDISQNRRPSAFSYWLRTGRLPVVRTADGRELKFNPYHDPRNGRFTFAPGGPAIREAVQRHAAGAGAPTDAENFGPSARAPIMGRGPNASAFEDPMTLEQVFPGLQNAPGGAIIAVADNLLDLSGPGEAAQAELLKNQARDLTAQIKAIDPNWHYDEIGPVDSLGHPIESVQGLSIKVNDLRFQRAAFAGSDEGRLWPAQG